MPKKLSALIVATAFVALSLTACSSSTAADCTGGASAGDASNAIGVTGKYGSVPKVDFPTPLKAKTTEVTEVSAGHGDGLIEGQKAIIDMSVFNGTTGALIEKTEYSKKETSPLAVVISKDQIQAGLAKGLTCATEGSRIALVVPPKDAFGTAGNANIGVGAKDDIVFVIDVTRAYPTRADGADQPAKSGFPAVVLDENGRPGISIPTSDAPKDFDVAVLKKGDGPKVAKGDTVTVQYTGVVWDSREVFDSTWKNGYPASVVAASGTTTQGGVIDGFADAIVGQTVGSQVIAIIPPDKGYGDKEQSGIPAGSTLVFVVDILGIG